MEIATAGAGLLPVFLKLEGRTVLLVGGGRVAHARLPELIRTGARVVVIAPDVLPGIAASGVTVLRRPFVASDLDEAWFVLAAAPPEVNREVVAAAEGRRLFVNAVDDRAHASAYLGGVFRRGGVTVAVSTEGRAPALAGLLREGLEAALPEDIEAWVITAEQLRRRQRAGAVPMGDRRPLLLEALNRLYRERGTERAGARP